MKIKSVKAAPLNQPFEVAAHGVTPPVGAPWTDLAGIPTNAAPDWPDAICVVKDELGLWGFGATTFAGPVVPIINEHLSHIVVGQNIQSPDDLTALWDRLDRSCGAHYGTAGVASYAISAVDLALWDLFGKVSGQPVWALLGGDQRAIPTYATGTAAEDYLQLGHRAVKLPCALDPTGGVDHKATVAAVARARERLGSDVPLMLDAWDLLDADAAIELGSSVAEFDLTWFEDSVFPEDWDGYRRLRAALPDVRLAAGERWYTHRPFAAMAEGGAVDVMQPDPLWVGGVTPVLRIAETARAHGVDLALHCGGNDPFGQHLSTALPEVNLAEVYYGGGPEGALSWYRSLAGAQPAVNGTITASEDPGFGFRFDLNAVERATSR